jgi:ammonium transporter, Amt family
MHLMLVRGSLEGILIGAFAGLAGPGLIYGGAHLFGVQLAGVAITVAYSFGVTWVILKFVNIFVAVRVSPEEERLGLDEMEHGEIA